jgi:hypothetical protein
MSQQPVLSVRPVVSVSLAQGEGKRRQPPLLSALRRQGWWSQALSLWLVVCVVGVATLSLMPQRAAAGELPVVGVATGDDSRATVIEALNTLSTFDFDVPGYVIVTPRQTARRIDEHATRQRQLKTTDAYDAEVDALMKEGWELLEAGNIQSALAVLQTALEMVEYGQPPRVRPGSQERWYQTRMLMTAAHLQNPASPSGDIPRAKATLQPVATFFATRNPHDDGFGPVMVRFFDEAVRDLYLLPHGRITVETFGGPYEVFINGLSVGESPVKDLLLPVGDYSVEVGRADKTGRIHQVEISRGKTLEMTLDPLLEQNLRTEGFAMYEAEDGQDPATTSLFVGQGVSKLTGSRYALIVGAPNDQQGGERKALYIALVDAESGSVLREQTTEVSSVSDERALASALEHTLTGRDPNESEAWQFERWAWIVSSALAVGCFIIGGYYIADGVDLDNAAQNTVAGSAEGDQLSREANTSFLIGSLGVIAGLTFTGVAIYYAYLDSRQNDKLYQGNVNATPSWQLLAAPMLDSQGQANGMAMGMRWRF